MRGPALRLRALARALVLVLLLLGTTAGSCIDDAARLGRAGSDEALRAGTVVGDDAARQAPTLGTGLRSRIQTLSDDEEVQDAAYGLAWDVMCDVVTNELPRSLEDVVSYLLGSAANFGLSFVEDEGAQALGEAVLDELDGSESEIRQTCGELAL